jgi:hypothetical protein
MLRALCSLLRLDLRRSRLRTAALSGMIAMSGCSFGEETSEPMEQNSCQVDSDCATQHCQAGRCVTKSQEPLNISLVITPTRMPDGSAPFPIVSKPFALRGGEHGFMFRLPVSVPVRVYDSKEDREIPALVTFTPLDNESRLTLGTTSLTTVAPSADKPQPGNHTMLLGDTAYTALIQPVDPRLPPHSLKFTVESGGQLEVDYASIGWQTRTYLVRNLSGETYNVRARVKSGGAALSNTAQISGTTGVVSLVFDPGDLAYELELAPSEQRYYVSKDDGPCGVLTPRPTLTVDTSSLKRVLDSWVVELPKLPDPVEYQAVISSCLSAKLSGEMPVTLRTSSLIFDSSVASGTTTTSLSPVTGKFETDTTATWDPDLGALSFCARVPPGDYTVLVLPTANLSCEVFAERRLLTPRSSADANTERAPDDLQLQRPTTFSGRVYTPDRTPMANATVNLVALHRNGVVKEDDRSVLSYNRSRQVTTSPDGMFVVPVDLGSYDVIVKPPAQSNYAWRVLYDIAVGSRTTVLSTEVMLSAPVVINGKLRYEAGNDRDQSSLASADVHAYTLVDEGMASERSVEVARGQADASGNVTLLMPPQLQRAFIPE